MLKVDRGMLMAALNAAKQFRGASRSTLPILSAALLQSGHSRLVIEVTDLDTAFSTTIPAEGDSLSIVTPLEVLTNLIANTKSDTITLSCEHEEMLSVSHERGCCTSRFDFLSFPAQDFPVIPRVNSPELRLHVGSRELAGALKSVLPFAAKSRTGKRAKAEPSISLLVNGGTIDIAASDGFRFNQRSIPLVQSSDRSDCQIAVVAKALTNLMRLCKDAPSESVVTILVDESAASFHLNETKHLADIAIRSRLIPSGLNVEKLRATFDAPAGSVSIERKELNRALQRLKRIAKLDNNRVMLHIVGDSARLSATSHELGTAEEAMDSVSSGNDITLGFNMELLLASLKSRTNEQVAITYQADPLAVVQIDGALIKPIKPSRKHCADEPSSAPTTNPLAA